MPKRQSTQKVASPDIQGDDSYVVVRRLKYGMAKRASELQGSNEPGAVDAFTREVVVAAVEDWNWVDDDGEPLKVPSADPNVIDDLTGQEINWIVSQAVGGEVNRKN